MELFPNYRAGGITSYTVKCKGRTKSTIRSQFQMEVLVHDSTRDGSTSNSNDIAGASHIRSKQTDDNALELKSK